MNILQKCQNSLAKIPSPIVLFSIKAITIFIVWQLVYLLLLMPTRVIDQPLSLFTAHTTASALNLLTNDSISVKEITENETIEETTLTYAKAILFKNNKKIISIADGCNGLTLFVLYIGFIIAYPTSIKAKIIYTVAGLFLIVLINILRTTGLAYLAYSYPKFLPFAHHYLYKMITYALIFAIWVHFTKRQNNKTIANA